MTSPEGGVFAVKTEVFEGPFDLLLSLVEKRKLFVNDIALAAVADDYVVALREREGEFPVDEASLFLVIASSLMLLKSRSLLPNLTLSDTEEADIETLEDRLRQYEHYRRLSREIQPLFGTKQLSFREAPAPVEPVFAPGADVSIENLSGAMALLMTNLPKKEFVKTVTVRPVISIEEMMQRLAERVRQAMRLSWRDIVPKKGEDRGMRVETIVAFLALLELIKRGAVLAEQRAHFEDIYIENTEVGVPSYL